MCAGVGMLVRKMGASFKPSQLISCDGDKWTIKTVTSFKTTEISFTPGVEFDETTADGRNMKVCRSFGWMIFPLECFFGIEVHVALDWNPGPGYNILLLRLIPGDILSTYSHRQFHTPPGLLDSRAALSNSYQYPNTCVPSREAVCTIFMMVFGMTRPGANPRPTAWEAYLSQFWKPNAGYSKVNQG